jgi:alkanesulfonate monooxygenase SsuD/methylene tetrahydromethanopterin reductase-like flavin-dependent oxidoreductase (luciferase family)
VGAAWNEDESLGLGFGFPPVAERFQRLEEALQICLQMWSDSEEPYKGKYYQLGRTLNSPQSLQRPHPFLMIGGGGEKKTLRLVAQYADACNIAASPAAGHKLDVLRQHCEDAGRDYSQIEKTTMVRIDPATTRDDIVRSAAEMKDLGFTTAYVYASGITEPAKIIDLMAEALPQLA